MVLFPSCNFPAGCNLSLENYEWPFNLSIMYLRLLSMGAPQSIDKVDSENSVSLSCILATGSCIAMHKDFIAS